MYIYKVKQKDMDYNAEIRYLGYQIQKAKGIVYPSEQIANKINEECLELKRLLIEYKEKDLKGYNDSSAVNYYKQYAQ